MDFNSLYLISNGSVDYFPQNKLTNFTNHLSQPIEFNEGERWEVGVESFGISCNFKKTDLRTKNPHILISKCQLEERLCDRDCDGERPVKFEFNPKKCVWEQFSLKLQDKEIVSPSHFTALSEEISKKTGIFMTYLNGQLVFDLNENSRSELFWIAFNKKFSDAFGLTGKLQKVIEFDETNSLLSEYDPYYKINDVVINGEKILQRQTMYNGEEFNVYNIGHSSAKKFSSLKSDVFVLEKNYPKLVKIICNIIEPQIFNNTYSRDLLVFSPDFEKTDDYYFKEIECVDFIPVDHSKIKDISIQLTDENNELLNIVSGQATIIKLRLKKMSVNKQSFNIRLSSEPSNIFPNNKNYSFQVKMPYNIDLAGGDWRVCINSFNHPTKFSTMLVEEEDRMIVFRPKGSTEKIKHVFKPNCTYDEKSIISELDYYLQSNGIGNYSKSPSGERKIRITAPGKLVISRYIGGMLGISQNMSKHFRFDSSKTANDSRSWDASPGAPKVVDLVHPLNLDLLKPNYIMIYSNIVKSTAIAGNFAKILKIVPLKSTDLNYVIQEFRTKEFTEIETTQIDVIEIHLRSHDGAFINFLSNQNVILNLEFTNYYD
jgi:hypothetical protein